MNKGQKRHSWFNISSLPPDTSEFDESSIEASVLLIRSIILSEVHSGTDSRRIVVIGFSQGAVITMMLALTNLIELGGLVSLCGWVPDIPPSQKVSFRFELLLYPRRPLNKRTRVDLALSVFFENSVFSCQWVNDPN